MEFRMSDEPGPFDLRPIHVHGELLHARPTEWTHEDFSDPDCKSTRYESSCPKCGQLIQFGIKDEVVVDSDCAVGDEGCPFWNAITESLDDSTPVGGYAPSSISVDVSEKDVSSRSVKEVVSRAAQDLAQKIMPNSLKSPKKSDPEPVAINDDSDSPFQDPVAAGELKLSE
jgi:hypothetical protein